MKIRNKNQWITRLSILCSLACGWISCESELKDEHYYQSDEALASNLIEVIKADAELSTFYSLLEQTGYDSLLTTSQSFTVWAPTNDALSELSSEITSDSEQLFKLIGNHINRYAKTSQDVTEEGLLVKMFNDKYVESTTQGDAVYFDESTVVEGDILTNNGILHKIGAVVPVKPNIWSYLKGSTDYLATVDYIEQFETIVFDPTVSTVIGKNSVGKTVYDSVYVVNNSLFFLTGELGSEEIRSSYLALKDNVLAEAIDYLSPFYQHPNADTTYANAEKTIFNNLTFPELDESDRDQLVMNTFGNFVTINSGSIVEDIKLSNGNIMVANQFNFAPEELIYKPIRYEVEDATRRTIGDPLAFTINKKYSSSASGQFYNSISLSEAPDANESNSFFEVEFSNVLSADYEVFIKFVPVNAGQDTKLKFELTTTDLEGNEIVYPIESMVVNNQENGRIQIGEIYSNPVWVNSADNNKYKVKLKVLCDVSEPETVLYDRNFGLDYVELVPVLN